MKRGTDGAADPAEETQNGTQNAPPEKATDRLLTVFEMIAAHGPVALADLTAASGLPRSAVHRAAQVLQRRGWVRARLSDHAYAVSSRFDDAIADARYSHEDAEALAPVMAGLAADWSCHADLALFVARGVFEAVDSTERAASLGRRSLTASTMAVAAQVALPPAGRVRHLEAFLAQASAAEAEFVTSGRHFRQMRSVEEPLRAAGLLVEGDHAATAPFVGASGVAGALRLRARRTGVAPEAARDLRARLDAAGYRLPPPG